ncbi:MULTISPECIES: hypothetical protein [unclassified Bradyrhizobium]|uniref:hypothetical protein n=1 Tax=unclassified Bradyrhizobium TaxID=2631580 RepID=UPI0028EF889D|nr:MULTISPECIES: hypothetical protein [unclassified Bradyrhizobium]
MKGRTRKVIIGIFALTVAAFAVWTYWIWSFMEDFARCRNVVLSSTLSPDSTKAVFVFRQECNATVPDSTWASVATADGSFVPNRNTAFLGVIGGAEVLSSWHGNDVIEVALMPGGGPFLRQEERAGVIRINYK